MTKIKFCGLSQLQDIEAANILQPDYIGFVFAGKSRRYVSPEQAAALKSILRPDIMAVGVFVDAQIEEITQLAERGIIDVIQLHGSEDESYMQRLRLLTDKPIIKAFIINNAQDIQRAEGSSADYILLDGGKGNGRVFDWNLLKQIKRPYFLAGGLTIENAAAAVAGLHPFAVDVSSGIESSGRKDKEKMAAFAAAVRKGEEND